MKNLLLLIVAVALYFHFYPNKEVSSFYNKQKQTIVGVLNEMGNTKVRLKSDKIYQDLSDKLARFSDKEVEHLKEISSSRENVKTYFYEICLTEKRDIIFHINNEKMVCKTISSYSNML